MKATTSIFAIPQCLCVTFPTIDISPMVQHGVHTGSIPRVPDPDGVVPGARYEQVGDLRVPQEAADWACVALQDTRAAVLSVVPHSDGAVTMPTTLFSLYMLISCCHVVLHIYTLE